jgi:hypothetical protein
VRFRATAIFLLVFQAIWLNVILPGHTRGLIALGEFAAQPTPAAEAGNAGRTGHDLHTDASCCAPPPVVEAAAGGCCGTAPAKSGGEAPARRAAHCAVCFFAVTMAVATPVDLRPPALEMLEILPPPASPAVPAIDFLSTYFACGPPAA